ncbi:unnamed protein product [Ectocarpus fasciculatus]
MADYGFRVLNGGSGSLTGARRRDFFDPASQRSAVEEFTRLHHRRVEEAAAVAGPASSSRQARVAAAGEAAAAAAAAAALGMPPSAAYGVVGPRGHAHHHPLSAAAAAAAAAGSAGFGHAEGDPWFSLRPNQPSRGAAGAMAPGRRLTRETSGRSGSSGRSAGSSAAAAAAAAMGLGQPVGAGLKSVHGHGRVGGGGSNWRSSVYLNEGRLSLSGGAGAGGGGGRTRLHGNSARADTRGGTHANVGPATAAAPLDGGNLTNPGGGPGRSLMVTVPTRSIRKAHGVSGLHGGGASASGGPAGSAAVAGTSSSYPNPLVNGVGLAPPPSSSPGLHYSSSGGSQPSRGGGGGGGGGLHFGRRNQGRAATAQAPSPAPMLDLGELIAGHDDASSRSEWDDVLASFSTPMQATDDARSNSPGATRG